LKYTLLTAYVSDGWQKPQSVSLDHNGGCLILSEDKFTFSRTIMSEIFGKTMFYSCTYLIIITSEMILIVFFCKMFFKPFLRNKIDPMPLKVLNCRAFIIQFYWTDPFSIFEMLLVSVRISYKNSTDFENNCAQKDKVYKNEFKMVEITHWNFQEFTGEWHPPRLCPQSLNPWRALRRPYRSNPCPLERPHQKSTPDHAKVIFVISEEQYAF
jgi:hypothetical protein